MKNTKNVVYTFSNILDYIENLEIDKTILGKISKESIKHLKISDFKSENEFEKQIDQFLDDKDEKICIIKFKPNEGNFMNYIKFFIKNKEKDSFMENKNEQSEKAFIFIVHLSRINNLDLENLSKKSLKQQNNINKKKLNETISLLSEYDQTFIDNLNGTDEQNLNKILKYEEDKELYDKCLNIKNALNLNIYKCLSFMKFTIPSSLGDLSENTYVNELIKYISNHNELQNDINNCLKKQLNNEKNIIEKVFKSEFSINSYDIDMISVIIRYLSESYTSKLSVLYYKAEQDQFFSSLLSINELNKIEMNKKKNKIIEEGEDVNEEQNNEISKKIIEKTRDIYLNELDFTDNEDEKKEEIEKEKEKKNGIIEKPGMNEINIILGLKLPGITSIISILIKKFKNEISRIYKKNENFLRESYSEQEVESKKKIYIKKLKMCNNSMFVELDKNELISKITKDEYEKNEFFDMFLDDFYTLFIDKNLNKKKATIEGKNIYRKINDIDNKIDYNSIKKFLKLIIKKRMEPNKIFKEDNPIKIAASSLNWIESYELDITNILEMFSKLNKIIDNLYQQIKEIFNKNKIKYEVSKRSKEYKSIVNEPLFYGMESILKVTTNEQIYIDLINNKNKFSKLININKEILQLALKMEANYDFYSKEVYSLQEILLIIDCLDSNKKLNIENIKKIISFFSNETDYINQNNENELIESFKTLYENIENLIGNNKSFNKIMSTIFKNEFIKITADNFRKELLEIIMKKDEFIYNNYQIFKYILYVDNNPALFIKNKKNILEKQNPLIKVINNCEKPYLEETIFNIFENKILNYFNMIQQIDFDEEPQNKKNFEQYYRSVLNEKPNETLIIFDLSLKVFSECIEFLEWLQNNDIDKEKEKEKQNQNLYKLYCISYIKIYLSKLANFIYDNRKYQEMPEIISIVRAIKGGKENNKFRKLIKIYVF